MRVSGFCCVEFPSAMDKYDNRRIREQKRLSNYVLIRLCTILECIIV